MGSCKKFSCIPQNDLDCYYNNQWKKIIRESYPNSNIDNFTIQQEKIDDYIYNLIMDITDQVVPPAANRQSNRKIAKFRDSYFTKSDQISPKIKSLVENTLKINTIADLSAVIRLLNALQIITFCTIDLTPHYRLPQQYVISIGESNGLDFDITDDHPHRQNNIVAYLHKIHQTIKKRWTCRSDTVTTCELSDSDNFVSDVLQFHFLMKKLELTEKNKNDLHFINNSYTIFEFYREFDYDKFWQNTLADICSSQSYICIENIKWFHMFRQLLIDASQNHQTLTMIKNYIIYCIVEKYGIYYSEINLMKKYNVLFLDNQSMFVQLFCELFGHYFESIYVEKHRNDTTTNYIQDMFDKMKNQCRDTIKSSVIFGSNTRKAAIEKLDNLNIILNKQDYYYNSTNVKLTGDFITDLMTIETNNYHHRMSYIDRVYDRTILSMRSDALAFYVNAYYDPSANSIYIPTAILDGIFVDPQLSDIYNYGSIGIIIGHEIMHAFDNQGALFDSRGLLVNWWDSLDYCRYNEQVSKVKRHYSQLTIGGRHIDADKVVSESIADIAGIKLSLQTLCNNNNISTSSPELKLFFRRWANTMRGVYTSISQQERIEVDEHPPNIIRINAPFSHLDEYYQIYNLRPSDTNYLPVDQRSSFMN